MKLDLKKPTLSLKKPALNLVKRMATPPNTNSPYKIQNGQEVRKSLATTKATQMARTMN